MTPGWVHAASFVSALVPLVIGIVLIRRSRARRHGDAPHCRRCDYQLTGITSDRCPECGAHLVPDGVVRGQQSPAAALLRIGLIVTFLGSVAVVMRAERVARDVNWYRWRPDNWVIDDLRDPAGAGDAWSELESRAAARKLSKDQYLRMADAALALQGARNPPHAWNMTSWLGDAVYEGRLSSAQVRRFLEQSVQLTLNVRQKAAPGDAIPYRVDCQYRSPMGSRWRIEVKELGLAVDGKPVRTPLTDASRRGSLGPFTSTLPGHLPTGTHAVDVTATIRLRHSDAAGRPDDPGIEGAASVSASTEVLPADQFTSVVLVTDPSLKESVRRSIVLRWVTNSASHGYIRGVLDVRAAPTGICFDVVLRAAGTHYHCSPIDLPKSRSAAISFHAAANIPPTVQRVDLILRPNERRARRTLELTEIWNEELTFESVPVMRE